jgi:uncharacterized protein involved in exopolysaccharide biosynthesis
MDQGLDKSKPPSTSYRETFRRHRKLFCMPIILGAVAAAFFLFSVSKTYKSTASLWVNTSPPAQSSLGAGSSVLSEPPASAEQGILNELLSTDSFTTLVAKHSLLRNSLGAGPTKNASALLGPGQIVPTVAGNQILQITYSASSPAVARSVLTALVAELRTYSTRLTTQHDQAAIAYDTQQVKVAEKAVATARRNVSAYQAQHPGVTQTDPNYVSLMAAENNAVTQLAQANTALSQVTGTGAGAWSLQVIDPPSQPSTTTPRKSKMAEVILGGALGGALVAFLAVVALTPARKERWEDELPVGGPMAPDLSPSDPFRAPSPRVPTAPAGSTHMPTVVGQPRLSLGDRRFALRSRSAPSDDQ